MIRLSMRTTLVTHAASCGLRPRGRRAHSLPTELAGSYELCRRIHRRFDPTYYWATRRLPPDVRPAVHALYGFVRGADELVDGPRRPPDPGARRAALDAWEGELSAGLRRGRSDHPVIAALVDAGTRHDLPLDELRVYMRSMRVDCGRVRMATADELDRYMDGSAGSVGRIMAPLLGVPQADAHAFGAMGKAFQLTNFLRDVREDWVLDRVYLPAAPPDELTRREAGPRLREVVAGEVARARSLFGTTAAAVDATNGRVRPAIRLARAVYLRVLERIERGGYDVLGRRTELTPLDLLRPSRSA
jgi:15-cis-phytoene synthase